MAPTKIPIVLVYGTRLEGLELWNFAQNMILMKCIICQKLHNLMTFLEITKVENGGNYYQTRVP